MNQPTQTNQATESADALQTQATQAAEDPQSRVEVDVGSKDSLDRWANALGTTDEALMNAVAKVGRRIDKIKDFLGGGGMAGSQAGG